MQFDKWTIMAHHDIEYQRPYRVSAYPTRKILYFYFVVYSAECLLGVK